MGFLTRDDRALVDCTTPRVDVALRDSVTLFPVSMATSRMKKPRNRAGQSSLEITDTACDFGAHLDAIAGFQPRLRPSAPVPSAVDAAPRESASVF